MPKNLTDFYVNFRPAEVHSGKEIYIAFYALNPLTNKLQRVKYKQNHLAKSKSLRLKFARLICLEINNKLQNGWNPFVETMNYKTYRKLIDAITSFINIKKKELRPDSLRTYTSNANKLIEWLRKNNYQNISCEAFNKKHANELMFVISEDERISNKTYNNNLLFYRCLFNFFIDKEYIKENPFERFKNKRINEKTRITIPQDVRHKILQYFVNSSIPEYLHICQLCYKCLIRPKEILQLIVGDINFEDNIITIPAAVAKNHKERMIAVPPEIMQYFSTLKHYNKDYNIFSTDYKPGKKLLTTRDTGRTWSKMREALKLPVEYQFYSLKDTGITELLEAGVPAKFVKELADHSSLAMTEKYTHKSSAEEILRHNTLEF
jgi:site-specific recombinase XerD